MSSFEECNKKPKRNQRATNRSTGGRLAGYARDGVLSVTTRRDNPFLDFQRIEVRGGYAREDAPRKNRRRKGLNEGEDKDLEGTMARHLVMYKVAELTGS